jgi:5-methylcytosine-specific restriction protein A
MLHRRRRGPAQRSPQAQAYHRWYYTKEWRALRRDQLEAEPLCRFCRAAGRGSPANTADHVIPHRGNPDLFFDPANLQSLCGIHHGEKQRIECGLKARVPIGADGYPLGLSPLGGGGMKELTRWGGVKSLLRLGLITAPWLSE